MRYRDKAIIIAFQSLRWFLALYVTIPCRPSFTATDLIANSSPDRSAHSTADGRIGGRTSHHWCGQQQTK